MEAILEPFIGSVSIKEYRTSSFPPGIDYDKLAWNVFVTTDGDRRGLNDPAHSAVNVTVLWDNSSETFHQLLVLIHILCHSYCPLQFFAWISLLLPLPRSVSNSIPRPLSHDLASN